MLARSLVCATVYYLLHLKDKAELYERDSFQYVDTDLYSRQFPHLTMT